MMHSHDGRAERREFLMRAEETAIISDSARATAEEVMLGATYRHYADDAPFAMILSIRCHIS